MATRPGTVTCALFSSHPAGAPLFRFHYRILHAIAGPKVTVKEAGPARPVCSDTALGCLAWSALPPVLAGWMAGLRLTLCPSPSLP